MVGTDAPGTGMFKLLVQNDFNYSQRKGISWAR